MSALSDWLESGDGETGVIERRIEHARDTLVGSVDFDALTEAQNKHVQAYMHGLHEAEVAMSRCIRALAALESEGQE